MSLDLSEEAFTMLYYLRESVDRARDLLDKDLERAKEELAGISQELRELIGPGVP